jgi:hypothetical protein
VDVLLVYVPKIDKILRFEPSVFCGKMGFCVNLNKKPDHGQIKGVRFFEDFVW